MFEKVSWQIVVLGFALLLEPIMILSLPVRAASESILQEHLALKQRKLLAVKHHHPIHFTVPNITPSQNLRGGSPAGICSIAGEPRITVVALMPSTNIGLTVAEKPTIFFRVSKTSVQEAQFKLLDEKGDTIIYEKNLPLTDTGDVRSFTLPADAPALEIGKEYQWELVVNCDPDDPNGNPRVRTAIKRVQPSSTLVSKLAQAKLSDRPDLYAQEGIWIDALSTLAQLRVANPNDSELKEEWISLLKSVGLQEIAKMPVMDSVP